MFYKSIYLTIIKDPHTGPEEERKRLTPIILAVLSGCVVTKPELPVQDRAGIRAPDQGEV